MAQEHYKSSIDHLTAELRRIDLLIGSQYRLARRQFENKGEFHGLYISDEETAHLIKNPLAQPAWSLNNHSGDEPHGLHELRAIENNIDSAVSESRKLGIDLRLDRLRRDFGLDRKDLDILLVCLAPEMSSGYEKIFAYLQDDLTRKKPSVDLVLNILSSSFEDKMALRLRFQKLSPLMENRIIHTDDEQGVTGTPFISRYLHVDERIVSFLIDERQTCGQSDLERSGKIRVTDPVKGFNDLILNEKTASNLENIVERKKGDRSVVLYLYGPYGSGKKSVAGAVSKNSGKRLLVADLEKMADGGAKEFHDDLAKVFRESVLQNALIYWEHGQSLLNGDHRRHLSDFMTFIESKQVLCFLSGRDTWEPKNHFCGGDFIPFEFRWPPYDQRIDLWKQTIAAEHIEHHADLDSFAAAFMFSGGQIRDAVQTARNLALKKSRGNAVITEEDLRSACLLQSNRKLAELARQIKPSFTWNDIVLPEDRVEQLKDIVNHARHKSLVLDNWGFGRKLSYGKGLSVLFSGPSGTGKTMGAEIMAQDLGLYLYKIDLARVVSKYIGETEKNLSKIFEEAETSNAILFFDEADAIFGKRSEVHDAHDRYANIETSYLLQKMEEYEGITILATNFKRNMDDAFVRRIQYAVEFPFPDTHNRKEIWKKTWPNELPLSQDMDFDSLAERFEMSGGNIKNICLNAAFIAAGDGRVVTMNHVMKATRNEYRKMGKLLVGNEFSDMKKAVGMV